MGSIKTPFVTLDKTLADYYAEENLETDKRIVLVASYTTGIYLPNQRYIYHDEDWLKSKDATPNGSKDMESTTEARILRVMGPLKFSICAGPMPLIMFDAERALTGDVDAINHFRTTVETSLDFLDPSQRPKHIIFRCPSEVSLDDTRFELAVRVPEDGMRKIPHVLDPDMHYEVLSKRGLAQSSIKTPPSQIFDLGTDAQIYEQQLSHNRKQLSSDLLPEEVIQKWKDDVLRTISTRSPPFVVKLQQTIFGKGTFVIKTSKDRAELVAQLPKMLQHNLSRTNASNFHLRPATFIVSDFITCSIDTTTGYALTIFLRRDGTPEFICCTVQTLSESHCWEGASITFSEQDHFERRFSKTIRDVAGYLNSRGYYGPVGIDVLEDLQGEQWVVDLNVRPPGSLMLGLLKGFLNRERGFNESQLISLMRTVKSKEEFLEVFEDEVAYGSIINTAWFSDVKTGDNWIGFVVSGENKADVRHLLERLQMFK
jgi:hypothetical protein